MHTRVLAALERRAPLTILRAPRGFGKTTSIARWLAGRDHDVATVYCSLDSRARTTDGFWQVLGDALVDAGVDDSQPSTLRSRDHVAGRLMDHPNPLRLIIDNFHEAGHLESPFTIDDDLLEVVRTNDQLEVVIGTRALRSLETAGALSVDLTIVRPADLALDTESVMTLAAQRGLSISEDEADELVLELGGWPAAIRSCLEAALVSESDAKVDGALVDGFVDTLLRDIVSDELREFLARTAIPEEFSAAAANAIVPGGRAIRDLRNLRVSGVLKERRTVAGSRYAYPPAIREAIVRSLSAHRPDVVREVHRALMAVAAREEGPLEVVRHAVHAEEWGTALRIIEEEWNALLFQYPHDLHQLARLFPPELVATEPRLDVITRVLPTMVPRDRTGLTWEPAAPGFVEEASRARGTSGSDAASVLFQTGAAAIFAGENDAASYAFEQLRAHGESAIDPDARLLGKAGLLMVSAIVGEVDQVLALAAGPDLGPMIKERPEPGLQELVAIACRIGVAIASADGVVATAGEAASRILEPRRRDEVWALAVYARALYASTSLDRDVRDRAVGDLRAAMRHLEPGGITEATLGTTLVELLVLAQQTGVAAQVLDRLAPSHVSQPTQAMLHLAEGRYGDAVRTAERSLEDARITVRARHLCDTTIAAALYRQGQVTAAHRQFQQAVQLSRASGQRRQFLLMPGDVFAELAADDPEVLGLRADAAVERHRSADPDGSGNGPGTVARPRGADPVSGGTAAGSPPGTATELLSPREIEVLRALQDHAGPAGVAEALGVSVNTAKTHVRSVYRKLGASGREEALRLSAGALTGGID